MFLTDLVALLGSGIATTDVFLVNDISAGTAGSKKIAYSELFTNIQADVTLAGGSDLVFVGTTGQCQILFTDNLASALVLGEGSNAYLTFCSTNSGEKIQVNKTLDFPGATGTNLVSLKDNLASALDFTEASNSYLKFVTTDGSEGITASKDLTLGSGSDLLFSGTTGQCQILFTDNLASALVIGEGSNAYITFVSTNSGEGITVSKDVTLASGSDLTFSGTTGQPQINLTDNLADALSITEAGNDYLVFCTTNSGEKVTVGKNLVLSADLTDHFSAASGDGAISQKSGLVYITKGSAAALTLADPTATTDDGKTLTVISATAFAHTVDNSAGSGFNDGGAGADVGTFGGAIGDNIVLSSYQGKWLVISKTNVVLG